MSVSFKGRFDTPPRQVSTDLAPRSRHPRWLRGVSLLTSATFVWSTVFALPARLWAEPKPVSPAPAAVAIKDNRKPTHFPNRLPVPANSLVPLSDLEVLRQKRLASAHPPAVRLTLLDETAHLSRSVSPAEVAGWKHDLTLPSLSANEKAKRHVWLGEWELAHNENLDAAKAHFAEARHLTPVSAEAHGVARFDTAILMMQSGHYADARTEFVSLIAPKTPMMGYDRQSCALWSRHAAACEGYHTERSKAGIVEPGRLDPLCGAAGLAVYLKSHGMPFDQKRVLSAVRVTGRGSNLQDVLDGAKKLGLKAWAVGGDEKVMQRLPKPLVAFVEHDHFIAVTATDKTGVTYLCADCGDWPGGRQHLSWKQWRKMDASAYGVFAKSGTAEDRWLTKAEAQKGTQFGGRPDLTTRLATGDAVTSAMTFIFFPTNFLCGYGNGTTQCESPRSCPGDCPPCDSQAAADAGDPVNLATLQEEYKPKPDLMVYNPMGPDVAWSRMYQSLRGYDPNATIGDFGAGWSTPFHYGVYANGTTPYIIEQNGARVNLTASAVPDNTHSDITCTVPPGYPMLVHWKYDSTTTKTYFEITFSDRTKYITTEGSSNSGAVDNRTGGQSNLSTAGAAYYALAKIVDRNGNYIVLNWTGAGTAVPPVLNSIADSNGVALLTVNRSTDGTIASVNDRYGRSVYYMVSTYGTTGVPYGYPQSVQGISHVSQIVATGTATPPDRYAYAYTNISNHEGETIPMLSSITVPSPTGTGTATATINYSPTTMTVSSLVDANGNTRTYSIVDANHTKVTITNAAGVTAGSYIAGFDNGMSLTTNTDGNGNVLITRTYNDSNNPYKASSVQDVAGHTTGMTWDQFGNLVTMTSARNVITTTTWDYTTFALGERKAVQTGSKIAISYTYAEPSGLEQTITQAAPGHAGDATTVTSTFAYDSLGNETSMVSPGNNAVTSITTAHNFTTDGTYTQTAARGQMLTITNNLNKVAHRRYNSQGLVTSSKDALGNEANFEFNIANQVTKIIVPATGQTGTGRSYVLNTYLYPGGPTTSVSHYDESGNLTRQVVATYGNEGELLSRVGGGEATYYTYDALYRQTGVKDANNQTVQYAYNAAGYPSQTSYPNNSGTSDAVQFSTYNTQGLLTQRADARGITTTYTYNDPENKLTDIQYSDSATSSVHFTYDTYGRRATMTDGTGSTTYSYDDLDRPLTVNTTFTGLSTQTVSYGYYPDGSRQALNAPGGNTTYTYDGVGHPTGLSGPSGAASWTYLDNDWLWTQTVPGTLTTTYTYNAMSLLTRVQNTNSSGTVFSDFSNLTYDGVGNCTSFMSNFGTTKLNGTTNFTFDSKNQLTQEQTTRGHGSTNSYVYDNAGNPTTVRNASGATYNADNQRTGANYVYDGNGNPTTYNGTTFTYDAENRMTVYGGKPGVADSSVFYAYNGDGLRALKGQFRLKTYYLYDDDVPIVELDSNGNVAAINTYGANGLIARKVGSTVTAYAFDPHGNVSNRVTGNTNSPDIYDAFGKRYSEVVATADVFGYKGQSGVYTDTETGLVLMTHRYFDPVTARWLTRDPVGTKGGTNLYAYCNNRPTRLQDREGTSPLAYACLPCASCLIDIFLVCTDSMDSIKSWAQCAIGVVQNLPWWLKLGCGGACLACLYDLIKDPPVICGGGKAAYASPQRFKDAEANSVPKPCSITINCDEPMGIICDGVTLTCMFKCYNPDGTWYIIVLPPPPSGNCGDLGK